ncbi:MAG TPA: DUF72 domain-containing protein [Burkholderiaceae bacterium]|nr:DUF72 domain-containing protein [Burkholderiaceae bacterium]
MLPEAETSILVGTASWTDPTLIKSRRFYPKGCSTADARLRYYASKFPLVEVNSSYYALPTVENSKVWVERTPAGFTFNVKAFRLFTGHQTSVDALPPPVRAGLAGKSTIHYQDVPSKLLDLLWQFFIEALEPLRDAGKLGLVHFQFAPWLTYSPASRQQVAECVQRLSGYTLSAELRHQTWFNDVHREYSLRFERDHGLVHTVVDAPQGFANTVGAHWEVTRPDLALVRLHGRNAATWNLKSNSASDRFNYDYTDSELAVLATSIRELATRSRRVHVIFNNNYEDQGQRNAATLRRLLRED